MASAADLLKQRCVCLPRRLGSAQAALFVICCADIVKYLPDVSIESLRTIIAGAKQDVLVYSDVSMESATYFLSFSRLAPLQVPSSSHLL